MSQKNVVRMQVARPPSGIVRPRWALEMMRHMPTVATAVCAAGFRLPDGKARRVAGRWAWQAAIEAVNQQQFDVICGFVDADIEIVQSGGESLAFDLDSIYRGPEGTEAFLRAWWEPWEECRLEPQELIDLGSDQLLGLNRIYMRGKGSGVVVTNAEAELWTMRRGRLARIVQFWNWDEALEAVGLRE